MGICFQVLVIIIKMLFDLFLDKKTLTFLEHCIKQ